MSLPSTKELKNIIVDILTHAREDGGLSQLTVRIVRQQLATRLDLEEDVLCSGVYKSFIKDTVHATVSRLENVSGQEESVQRKAPKQAKPDGASKSKLRQHKSKNQVNSDEEPPEGADVSESEPPRSKNASVRSKSSKPNKTSKKPESETKYKSKVIIESSGEESIPEPGTKKFPSSPKREKAAAKPSPPKQKQQKKVKKADSDVEMDTGGGPGPSSSSSKPKPELSEAKESTKDPMESELSSVIDEPPKKRQKKLDKEPTKLQKDEKTKRQKKEILSKDEETVNKLKGIVVACGVRKVWKKEFEGLDKPSQQIKRLHAILGDLGMTPRYTLEKAKAIRDRRELAQELKDVQEFAKAVKKRGKGHHGSSEIERSVGEDDADTDDGADVPTRKKKSARESIMAFLQDQSEEE